MTQPPPLPRRILHVDMDAFFASVEQRDNPVLRGRPVLVGGTGPRGVVCAASYEARPFGCRSAQPMAIALRNCPHAIVVKPNGAAYREASNTVFDILHSFTPQVQPLSIDEAFLDVTGSQRRFGDAVEIATNIRQQIHQRTQLTGSIGVAPNKFLAKLASEMDKPDGLTIVPENDIPQWLAPRPIGDMWGVGPAAERKLQAMGVRTFGDVQRMDVRHIESLLGSWGRSVHELAHGRDEREVHPDRSAKSISQERTFGMDVPDPDELLRWLLQQTEQVSGRLRRHELRAKAVTVKIRYGDFKTITRSKTLPGATDRSDELWNASCSQNGPMSTFIPSGSSAWARQLPAPTRRSRCHCSAARMINASVASTRPPTPFAAASAMTPSAGRGSSHPANHRNSSMNPSANTSTASTDPRTLHLSPRRCGYDCAQTPKRRQPDSQTLGVALPGTAV